MGQEDVYYIECEISSEHSATSDKGFFLKLNRASKEKGQCRFALKTGSVIFLLFFTLIAPLAPLVAQVGSALFILLVMVLSPFINVHQQPTEQPLPDPFPAAEMQTAELDSTVSEFVFYNEIPDAALRANQRQQLDTQANFCDLYMPSLRRDDSGGSFINDKFILNYPAEYLASCQPLRAGPLFI